MVLLKSVWVSMKVIHLNHAVQIQAPKWHTATQHIQPLYVNLGGMSKNVLSVALLSQIKLLCDFWAIEENIKKKILEGVKLSYLI